MSQGGRHLDPGQHGGLPLGVAFGQQTLVDLGVELGFVMGAGMDEGPRAGNFSDADANASTPAHCSGEQGGPMAVSPTLSSG